MVLDKYKDCAPRITKEKKLNVAPDDYIIEPNQLKRLFDYAYEKVKEDNDTKQEKNEQ